MDSGTLRSNPPLANNLTVHLFRGVPLLILLSGVVLRLVQWLGNPSFFLDEVGLAENVVSKGLAGLLTEPLGYGQVAPAGFLALAKVAVKVLGPSEMVLRLLPFLGSLLALLLFWFLSKRVLSGPGALVATAFIAFNPLLISLSGTFKQYSTDVLVTTILLWLALLLLSQASLARFRAMVGVFAGMLTFFSIPAVMVAAPAVAALVLAGRRCGTWTARWWREHAVPGFVWGLGALVASLFARHVAELWNDRIMQDFWLERGGFLPPFSEGPLALFDFLFSDLLRGLLFSPYLSGMGSHSILVRSPLTVTVLGLLAATGAVAWIVDWFRKGEGDWALLTLGPFALAAILSRFSVYPLDPRTSVFLLPLFALLVGHGLNQVLKLRPFQHFMARIGLSTLVLLPCFLVILERPPVYRTLPTREVFSELAVRKSPPEPIYGFYWSRPFLQYYGRRFDLEGEILIATSGDLRATLEELEQFKGQSGVWFAFPHSYGVDRDILLCFLKTVGRETDRFVSYGPTCWRRPKIAQM